MRRLQPAPRLAFASLEVPALRRTSQEQPSVAAVSAAVVAYAVSGSHIPDAVGGVLLILLILAAVGIALFPRSM